MQYIIVILVLIILFIIYKESNKLSIKNYMSFMETFNLTEMPIVTFFAGENKINFLLDTGSSQSFITENASNLITGSEMMCGMNVTSAQGTENFTCKVIDTILTYKNKDYDIKLFVNKGLDKSFNDIKASKGITLHGIIGADFLDKYSYILDFNKYIAYPKK